MAMTDPYEERRATIAAIQAQGLSLQSSLKDFQEEVFQALPETGHQAIHLDFDEDGILSAVQFDEATRKTLTEQRLCDQFKMAFALAPLPKSVIQKLVENPSSMQIMRDSAQLPTPVEFTSLDRSITLVAQLGRPVEVRFRPGAALMMSPHDLAAEVVGLARQAAHAEQGEVHE